MTTTSGFDDFQTIIFAAGKGSRMTQLLFGKPKCLLPIGNKPMIQYPLELLIRSNIKETFIIVLDTESELVEKTIHRLGLDIKVTYVVVASHHDSATVDSLRVISEKIKKDILMLSCDTITDFNLTTFVQLYRLKAPTFLCLLSSMGSEKENLVPAKKLCDNKEFDIVGLDEKEPNRLVFFEPDVMFSDSVPLKRSFLELCPNFKMQTNLKDAHVYMFKHWILDYLQHKENIKSIKSDFVPSLVRKQFRRPRPTTDDSLLISPEQKKQQKQQSDSQHLADFVHTPEMYKMLDQLESCDLDAEPQAQPYPNSLVKCYAQILDSGYCIRANSWVRYCEANRVLLGKLKAAGAKPIRSESVKSYVDGLVGHGSVVGEKCAIKRTVIGANCKIGDRVKLTNCIVLDGVEIEEGCAIQGSVVCYDVFVGNKAEIKDCIVGPRQKIVALGHYTNESLTEEMLDL